MEGRTLNGKQAIQFYDEMLLQVAASSFAKLQGEKLMEELDRAKENPTYILSSSDERKLMQVIKRCQARRTLRVVGSNFIKLARVGSMVCMVILIMLTSSIVASANMRDIFYRLIFRHEEQYTLVKLRSEMEKQNVDEIYTWENAYAAYQLPKGYKLLEVSHFNMYQAVVFQNDSGKKIEFWQTANGKIKEFQVDSEKVDFLQPVLVQGMDGLLFSKNGEITVIWPMNESFLLVSTQESIDTTLAIANSVSLIK